MVRNIVPWNWRSGCKSACRPVVTYGSSSVARTDSPRPSISEPAASLSISRLTFSHQMIRLLVVEQLYRAFTILRGENYHHE